MYSEDPNGIITPNQAYKWLHSTIRLAAQQIGITLPETYHQEALEKNLWLGR